jgi:UDP-N-acetylglucosamine--N-acetylmuramyl-(pentapeptide) pyrophosphoryl-undecaprenol N-acetylglucosamine transferase
MSNKQNITTQKKGARIIIAGGGTGGHIFPAVAVANALKDIDNTIEILFIGAKGKMEMEKIPLAGYEIKGLDISGFDRGNALKNITLPFKVIRSFIQVRSILQSFKPDAVFGVGGYSSYPVLRLAQLMRIKTFLHESNAFAGKSNMLLAKKAVKVFVAVEGMEKFFPAKRIVVSGNPVRSSIAHNTIDAVVAKHAFGLEQDKVTVFAMGGSLGARSINEAIDEGLDRILNSNLQLIWQTGKLYVERSKAITVNKQGVWANDFIVGMENAYAAADLVVSRSGAMSVTELCISAKPVVFVPFPFAAEDHQTANAKALVNKQAAVMIKDADVKKRLVDEVIALANNPEKRLKLSKNIQKFSVKDADYKIAKTILENI